MRFYYSLIILILNTVIFGLLSIFLVPIPKYTNDKSFLEDTFIMRVLEKTSLNNKSDEESEYKNYYLDNNSIQSRTEVLFIITLATFAIIFLSVVLFHHRSHVIFPMVASYILVLGLFSILWLFPNTLPKSIYIDLNTLKETYSSWINILRLLGGFVMVELLVILFGYWYSFPE